MTLKSDIGTGTPCTFKVKYTEVPVEFSVKCNDKGVGNDIHVGGGPKDLESEITIAPYLVTGCSNSDCSYDIKLGGSSIFSSAQTGYDGGEITFTGADSKGKKNYTLTIYDPTSSDSHSCNFSVDFKGDDPEPGPGPGTIIEMELNDGATLEKGKTYKLTKCSAGGTRIQMHNVKLKNCVDVFGSGGTYWVNTDSQCEGEIFISYPITVTIPSDMTVNCGY